MADESSAKKLKLSPPLIGTHNGHFHADEALAVYLLRLLPSYASSPLVRTRDPALLATCHTVVDVGGEYDAATHRYDHHQRSFSTTFPQHSTKLSSAGLVYMHFGRAIIAQHTGLPVDDEDVAVLYEKLYADFIEAIDANDNGIQAYDPAALAAANIAKRFKDGAVTVASIVGDMNRPDPASAPDEPQDEDSLFARASSFVGSVFLRKLHRASASWLPARAVVRAAYHARQTQVHASGRIIVLPEAGIPWKEHLYNCEAEQAEAQAEPRAGSSPAAQQTYYVLYPESADEGARWRVQCVPVSEASFESRRPLPEAWRGIRDAELDSLMAAEAETAGKPKIPAGAVFVHASGFIGGHQTKEGALAMAVRSLD